jgi:hypothetical protein
MPERRSGDCATESEHQLFHLLFIFFFLCKVEHGTEDTVPERAAYTEALVVIFIMVQVVIAPKGLHPAKRRIPGMDGIVHAPVEKIAEHKSGEEHKHVIAHDAVKNKAKNGGDDDTGHRGHKQPFPVAGEMMVVAVHDVDELFRPLAFGHPMKDKPVHKVFEKTPEQHAAQEGKRDPYDGKIQPCSTVVQEIYNYREVYAPDHEGMRLGQHLQVVTLEQLGLPFIMYFLEFHDSTIWQKYE